MSPPAALEDMVRAVRARAGFSRTEIAAAVDLKGPDRASFLQTQLPLDVTAPAPGGGAATVYLDRRGRVEVPVVLYDLGDTLRLIVPRDRAGFTCEKLERHHFREKLSVEDRSPDLAVLELHGPAVPGILSAAGSPRFDPARRETASFAAAGTEVLFLSDPWTGDPGGRLVVPRDRVDAVLEALRGAAGGDLAELDGPALEILRIEGGVPRLGAEIDERTLPAELDRPGMVSHDKGCYLGQETTARVHARGRVNRLLRGLLVEGDEPPETGAPVRFDGGEVGVVSSAVGSPALDRPVALAWIRPAAAEPGTVVRLDAGGRSVPATVSELPLYRPRGPKEEAEELHRRGLAAFTADRYAEAERLFERALLMNPGHVAALESLGVCQERLGRVDEAMETMRSLAEAEPGHVMAWTNLSRYHAQRGEIEEAERLKGHASFLVMQQKMGEREAERRRREESETRRRDLEEREGLFLKVLDLDPGDVVANFGLGKLYMDLERFEEAVPRFRRAVEGQKDYSMAFNHLAACLVRLGRRDEAREVLGAGLEAAARRGDLVPKADMTRLLEELDEAEGGGT